MDFEKKREILRDEEDIEELEQDLKEQLNSVYGYILEATAKNDYNLHYRMLICYYKVLSEKMTKKEREFHEKIWEEVRAAKREIDDLINKGKKSVPTERLDTLHYWEIQLKQTKKNIISRLKYGYVKQESDSIL